MVPMVTEAWTLAGCGGAAASKPAAVAQEVPALLHPGRQETHLVERGVRGEKRMPGRRCHRREVPRHRVVPASRARARWCLLLRPPPHLPPQEAKQHDADVQKDMVILSAHVLPEYPRGEQKVILLLIAAAPNSPEPEQGVVTLEEDRDPVERVEEALQCLAQDLL
ncbi:hypothetical protein ZWY2020_038353 [Hordeum vulgare]|nr:hypothetical protein ZWY2020_038353 [Hordeum vulgare]